MAPPSSLVLRHGRLFPLDSLPIPTLENYPVSVEVRGSGQTVHLRQDDHALTALPDAPPTAAIQWAGATLPLYVRSARYDLDSGHVHLTVQRPEATQADMGAWADLHGTRVPDWVHNLLGVTQRPGFHALSGPVVGAMGAVAVLRHGYFLLPALLAGAWGCRALANRGVPMQQLGAVACGQAVEFDTRVCLHQYMRLVAALDAQIEQSTQQVSSLLGHMGQLVDLRHTQITARYINHHGTPDRPLRGVGFSPEEITLVAGNGNGQGKDWQLSGFLHGRLGTPVARPPDFVSLGVSLGLNVPEHPVMGPSRRRKERDDASPLSRIDRRKERDASPLSRLGRRKERDASPLSRLGRRNGRDTGRASPSASPPLVRAPSVTDRLRPVLRELAQVSLQGSLQLQNTKTLFLEALWPGLPDLLRSCTVRTAKNRRLLVRTIRETPSSPHALVLEAPHRACVGLELGLGTMMQRRLPAFMDSIRAMPGAPVVQELVNALLPNMSLTVYLRKIVLRPGALLEEGAPWAEVHFSIRRLPVLPGFAGSALSRMPKMKKMHDHKVCLSGSLSVAHESPAWAVRVGDEQGSIKTLHLDMPMQVAQGCADSLSRYFAELMALYPPVLGQLLAENQAADLDLSALASAAARALRLKVDRTAGDRTAVSVHSNAPNASVSARLDLPDR